jgi:nitrogen fixation/metabolism regulation signal transduction histidine kinase
MRIRTKLIGYFLIVALLVPILGMSALGRIESINGNVQDLSENAVPHLREAQELQQIQSDQQAAALAYVATGDVEQQRRYLELQPAFEQKLRELTTSAGSDDARAQVRAVSAARERYEAAAAPLLAARVKRDQRYDSLRTRNAEIVQELNGINRRYVPTGRDAENPNNIPREIRNQINDLLLGTQGMLQVVGLQFSLATGYTVSPNAVLRQQFDTAERTFTGWMQIANNAGGTDDRTIISAVQTKYRDFLSSARAMMDAADVSSATLNEFIAASRGVESALSQYAAFNANELETVKNASSAAVTTSRLLIIVLTVASFLIAAAIGALFADTITRPIAQLRDVADRVSTGDVANVEINVDSKDEIGDLANAFRRMVASVRFLMMRDQEADETEDELVIRSPEAA